MQKLLIHPSTSDATRRFIKQPSHAVLLVGEAGSGKGYLSQYISSKILVEKNLETNIFRMDASSGAGIDEVRKLQAFLKLMVVGEQKLRRVIIVEHIDQLGHEAQNSLLKSLEEPPVDTVFICTASHINRLLPTVVSRMNSISVLPLTLQQAVDEYSDKHSKEEIERAYSLSDGMAEIFWSLLSGDSKGELGQAIEWAKNILKKTVYERLLEVEELSKDSTSKVDEYIYAIQKVLRASVSRSKKLSTLETKRRLKQLEAANDARQNLELNVNTKLVLTNLFIKL